MISWKKYTIEHQMIEFEKVYKGNKEGELDDIIGRKPTMKISIYWIFHLFLMPTFLTYRRGFVRCCAMYGIFTDTSCYCWQYILYYEIWSSK